MKKRKSDPLEVPGPCNYYGRLAVRKTRSGPEWSIENWDGHVWHKCPQAIYDAIIAEYGDQT